MVKRGSLFCKRFHVVTAIQDINFSRSSFACSPRDWNFTPVGRIFDGLLLPDDNRESVLKAHEEAEQQCCRRRDDMSVRLDEDPIAIPCRKTTAEGVNWRSWTRCCENFDTLVSSGHWLRSAGKVPSQQQNSWVWPADVCFWSWQKQNQVHEFCNSRRAASPPAEREALSRSCECKLVWGTDNTDLEI